MWQHVAASASKLEPSNSKRALKISGFPDFGDLERIHLADLKSTGTGTGQAAAAADELGPLPAKERTMLTTFLGHDDASPGVGELTTIPPLRVVSGND